MTILKGVPSIINPTLLAALARMGHGDEIVLADANFPAASVAAHTTLGAEIRIDGTGIVELLEAIMKLLPLDPVAKNTLFMEMMPEHKAAGWETPIWAKYLGVIAASGETAQTGEIERMAFYERAKTAFAVVSTGETALYGNLIVRAARRAPRCPRGVCRAHTSLPRSCIAPVPPSVQQLKKGIIGTSK